MLKNKCKLCHSEIASNNKSGFCRMCLTSNSELNPNYKDGRTSKTHYCKDCKNKISKSNFFTGKGYCDKCKGKGNRNPNFNKNNTHNNKCIDCHKHISKNANRCLKCAGKAHSNKQKGKLNHRFGKPPSHGKHIKYNNVNFRSSWEAAYAKYLNKQGIKWLYEPKAFDLGDCTYTPDFYLPESDTYVEIKGWWRDDAKKKFDKFQKKYYSMNIILLTEKELKKLKIIK